jgi:replicative DNA helicase
MIDAKEQRDKERKARASWEEEQVKEYEIKFLSGLLTLVRNAKEFAEKAPTIKVSDFLLPARGRVYKAILDQKAKGVIPDDTILSTMFLENNDRAAYDIVTLPTQRGGLYPNFTTANIKVFEDNIREASQWRQLANIACIFNDEVQDRVPRETILNNLSGLLREAGEQKAKSLFLTFDQYKQSRANREYWNEFSPSLFRGLSFPDGTISVIGARPGSGKSAALVNLVRELITTKPTNSSTPSPTDLAQDKNARRKVLFISQEMTVEDIADRLIHSLAWQEVENGPPYNLQQVEHTNVDYYNAMRYSYGTVPDYWKGPTEAERARQKLYKEIIEKYIEPAWGTRLDFAYTRGIATFDEILRIIRAKAEPGTLVLIDYVQLLPPMEADLDGHAQRYLEIRHDMDAAILAAEQTKSVILCAAQLGRNNESSSDKTTGWRESGDIEQTAWNALKLSMDTKASNPLSYEVVKARSGKVGDSHILKWVPKYQFMQWTDKKPKGKKGGEDKDEEEQTLTQEQKEAKARRFLGMA